MNAQCTTLSLALVVNPTAFQAFPFELSYYYCTLLYGESKHNNTLCLGSEPNCTEKWWDLFK